MVRRRDRHPLSLKLLHSTGSTIPKVVNSNGNDSVNMYSVSSGALFAFFKIFGIQFHSYCHLNFHLLFWVTLYKKHLKQSILLFVGAAAYYCVPSHSHMPTSHLKCLLVKPRSCAIYWGIRINWFFSLAQYVTYANDIE